MITDLQKYENYCIFSERKERKGFYTLLKIFLRLAKTLRSAIKTEILKSMFVIMKESQQSGFLRNDK